MHKVLHRRGWMERMAWYNIILRRWRGAAAAARAVAPVIDPGDS